FAVTYTDNTRVDLNTISPANITVRAPSGANLAVTGVTKAASADGRTVTATYTVAAPAGQFTANDNGSYTVAVQANQVTDAAGQAFLEADGQTVDLVLDNPGTLVIPSGMTLGNVTINGSVQSFTASRATLAGTLYASGGIGKLTLGAVSGGRIAAASSISSVK